ASSIRKGGVVLYYLKSENENSRFAVRVGRGAFKRAVDRNRAKRIARECFRISKSRFRGSFDLLVKIERDDNLFLYKNLQQTVSALLNQSKILSEKNE
ncbi:MAG: ribonuclease P protein component, partial [Candidatus Omnitrophica bacterium]|nr:ribonuclease P protein component [Candidatus Omnitrophota bacterium]